MIDVFVAKERSTKVRARLLDKGGSETKLLSPQKSELFRRPHLLHSYLENPEGLTFEDQELGEKPLLILRRHFVTNLHWIVISAILFAVPLFFIPFFSTLSVFDFLQLPTRYLVIFAIFYYLISFTYLFVNFITWYFNISLITDKKVIDIDYSNIVYKNVAATKHSLLQDASYSQIGVLRSLFDYGDVLVQTAGSLDNFTFRAVPKPERVVKIVEELIGRGEK